MEYIDRICETEFKQNLETFGAIHLVGPKQCGKTTMAKRYAKSVIEMEDPDMSTMYIETAKIKPWNLLVGEKPRLIDEWQVSPNLWNSVRVAVDRQMQQGAYILTGSNAIDESLIHHSGTGRIVRQVMYPMSLYETGESNGAVSLKSLFDKNVFPDGCTSQLSIDDLIFAACRGGWPYCLSLPKRELQLRVIQGYFDTLCSKDMSNIDGVKRDETTTRLLLRSYARNISTFVKNKTLIADVNATGNMSESTFYDYIKVLKRLYVIEDVEAWCPAIRSKNMIQSALKREFTDPSFAVAALGVDSQYFNLDLKTFGFIFETLCIRDLRVYSQELGGRVSYYHDRYGLEADAVLHLKDGRYTLIEIKLGQHQIQEGIDHLRKLEGLIVKTSKNNPQRPLRKPDLKIILTGTQLGYQVDENTYVVPIGCLKP